MFQGVTCTGFVTFCHLLEHSGSFLAHSSRFSIILAYSWDIPFPCLLVVLILSYLINYWAKIINNAMVIPRSDSGLGLNIPELILYHHGSGVTLQRQLNKHFSY